jgi:hypothetical protein
MAVSLSFAAAALYRQARREGKRPEREIAMLVGEKV